MKRKIILTGIAFFMFFIMAGAAQHSMPGVPDKVSVTKQEVVDAAAFAIAAQEKAMQDSSGGQTNKLELVEILEATQLVVDGINYQLTLKVKLNGKEKQAVANVRWQGRGKLDPYQLTYWKWSEERPNKSLQPTRVGAFSSASRFMSHVPAWLSSRR
jgi:hypothetical protein